MRTLRTRLPTHEWPDVLSVDFLIRQLATAQTHQRRHDVDRSRAVVAGENNKRLLRDLPSAKKVVFNWSKGKQRAASEKKFSYPMRAIRNEDYLYIHNFKPGRWPQGDPYGTEKITDGEELYQIGLETSPAYRDLDGSLTKAWLMQHQNSSEGSNFMELTLGKRPAEELYDLEKDPYQLNNLAADPDRQDQLKKMRSEVDSIMKKTNDPRLNDAFDESPWIDPDKIQKEK